jgi:hypothetical protein
VCATGRLGSGCCLRGMPVAGIGGRPGRSRGTLRGSLTARNALVLAGTHGATRATSWGICSSTKAGLARPCTTAPPVARLSIRAGRCQRRIGLVARPAPPATRVCRCTPRETRLASILGRGRRGGAGRGGVLLLFWGFWRSSFCLTSTELSELSPRSRRVVDDGALAAMPGEQLKTS